LQQQQQQQQQQQIVTAFENMEAKRLMRRLSDKKIEVLREKHKFHSGYSITSDKI